MKTLIIDNYDSFTYNLFQMIAEINNESPVVIHNDSHGFDDILCLEFDNIIISPGPGRPDKHADFGVCSRVILETHVPILGICLGHQGIFHAFGGNIIRATEPMHGLLSEIVHSNDVLFDKIPNQFEVTRYHSLICSEPMPDCLQIIAQANDGTIMALRHKTRQLWGVQFHPESICTAYGKQLLSNFRTITQDFHVRSKPRNPLFPNRKEYKRAQQVALETQYQLTVKKLDQFYQPDQVFAHLFSNKTNTVWLDSSRIMPGISRFSFIGCLDGPLSYSVKFDVTTNRITRLQDGEATQIEMNIFDFLKEELKQYAIVSQDLPFQFQCGFIGYLGYELYSNTLPIRSSHISSHPDAQFLFLDRVIVFDHEEGHCYLLSLTHKHETNNTETWFEETELLLKSVSKFSNELDSNTFQTFSKGTLKRDHQTYINDINQCLNDIRDGESYEICLTNKLDFNGKFNPYHYYSTLRKVNPAPYSAFLKFDDVAIACSSIERYLLIDKHNNVETKPIKGTLPRGLNIEEDQILIQQLQHDVKFRAENLMIVDLLRNDLGKICEIGSIDVPELMRVETYETVHQLVSTIRGKIKSELTAIDCIVASFPGGSMTGAPKIRSMEIINSLEKEARGIYSGSIGYLSLDGAADLNIVIRTAVITSDKLSIGIGGAITALSDANEEFQEIMLKSKQLEKALGLVQKTCAN
ncbi:MAG: aminodeoxychorismate synthase component I [Legionellaceae bacterium]|nr:aminodeoxychorismate synthase component I [Legionellaceae bacterium]